jgi:hypothetical protein
MTYIVSFQPAPLKGVDRIIGRLKSLGGYCPINRYCWAVATHMNAAQLRDYIGAAPGERIFVVRSGTEAAWANTFGPKNSEWLKANL